MIPITDIEDPRLNLFGRWTLDTRTMSEVEADVLRAPKRLAALLQAIRENTGEATQAAIFNRAREISL